MSNLLRWIVLLPIAFICYTITSYAIAFVIGRTLGKIDAIPFKWRLRLEWLAFGVAGFIFVLTGKLIAPQNQSIVSIVLFIIMMIVNFTSPARKDCRIVQVIGSLIAVLINN